MIENVCMKSLQSWRVFKNLWKMFRSLQEIQSINQSIVYLPFSFLTDYTSVVDFITLGQELSANPLGLFEESPWTSLQL